jgi:hypothetical protein
MRWNLLLMLLLVVLVSCTSIPPEKQCTQDADCVEATCCHSSDAVNKDYAPKCEGALCTASCDPGTTDCGQGQVKCVQQQCEVVLNE